MSKLRIYTGYSPRPLEDDLAALMIYLSRNLDMGFREEVRLLKNPFVRLSTLRLGSEKPGFVVFWGYFGTV